MKSNQFRSHAKAGGPGRGKKGTQNKSFSGAKERPYSRDKDRTFSEAKERPYSRDKDRTFSGAKERPYSRDKDRTFSEAREKPYSRDKDRTFSGAKEKPYSRDKDKAFSEARERPYSRDKDKAFSGAKERPYSRDKDRTFSGAKERPYSRDKDKAFSGAKERPYSRDKDRTFSGAKERPYSRDKDRTFSGAKERPYSRDKDKTFSEAREKPYSRDKDRTFSGAKERPYSRDKDRTFSGYKGKSSRFTGEKNYKSNKSKDKKPLPPSDGMVRLNKFIANSGVCSRREADEYIAAGLVTVNGQTASEMGTKVSLTDDIRFNGERLKGEEKVYIVMNKPKDFVTTVSDPKALRTVMQLLEGKCNQRVYPVGRLDRMTTGVLMFTNDGEMAEQLTHPSGNRKKIYQVHLDKNLSGMDFEKILKGVVLEDGPIQADALSYIDNSKDVVGIEIHSGRNRIVRRVFESMGYRIKKLDRVFFAGLTKKNLKRGQWRFLTEQEVSMLKMGAYE